MYNSSLSLVCLIGNNIVSVFLHRIIRELFLNCNGVNQMTELNYLDCVRNYSLKAFETLIFFLGDQQKDQVMLDLENEQKTSALDVGAFVHRPQAAPDVPQSLSKFYAGLKDVYPKKKSSLNQDVHVHMINIFLCVAFLCVSNEADADRDSANDSEDTSGYDSTASEPLSHTLPYLSPESLTLPSLEHIHRAADIWSVCRWIYLYNSVFQRQFHRLGGFEVCHRLIAMIIQKLATDVKEQSEQERVSGANDTRLTRNSCTEMSFKSDSLQLMLNNEISPSNHDETLDCARQPELVSHDYSSMGQVSTDGITKLKNVLRQERKWSLQGIRLLEAVLSICLHSANNLQQKTEAESVVQVLCN